MRTIGSYLGCLFVLLFVVHPAWAESQDTAHPKNVTPPLRALLVSPSTRTVLSPSPTRRTAAIVLGSLAIGSFITSITLQSFHGEVVSHYGHTVYDTRPFFIPGHIASSALMVGVGLLLTLP